MQESCYLIEEQMEQVRDLEKDLKSRKLNKQVYLDQNELESKFIDESDSDENATLHKHKSESEKESSEAPEDV